MNKNIVYSHIRRTSLKHLVIFILPLAFLITLLCVIPFDEVFFSEYVEDAEKAVYAYENGKTYVSINPSNLYYSGYDLMVGDKHKGSYYYEIIDNKKCIFFLLENDAEGKKVELSQEPILVRFEHTDSLFDNMLNSMSDDINWNYEDLSKMTPEIVLVQMDSKVYLYYLVFIVLIANIVYFAYAVIHNLLCIVFPVLHQSVRRIKSFYGYSSFKKLSEDLDCQMINESISAGGMHITDGFFIHLGSFYVNIVPLSEILFVYKNSQLKNSFGLHFKILYTLHIRGNRKFRCACPGKSKEDADIILDYFAANYPDILNGYTDENRRNAIRKYKAMKKQKRRKNRG